MYTKQIWCAHCGRYLLHSTADLPFEVESTGALLMKISVELKCAHCHKAGSYSILPEFSVDRK